MVIITALALLALVVIVTVIVSAAVISARRKRRESPGVVFTGPQPGSAAAAAAASLPYAQCSPAHKTVAPGNEQARVFNTYDVIADLPPVAMATDATGDDYLRPCLIDENTGGYWPDDHYDRVKFLDDDDSYYYYKN